MVLPNLVTYGSVGCRWVDNSFDISDCCFFAVLIAFLCFIICRRRILFFWRFDIGRSSVGSMVSVTSEDFDMTLESFSNSFLFCSSAIFLPRSAAISHLGVMKMF